MSTDTDSETQARGACPICGRSIGLTKAGRLRRHITTEPFPNFLGVLCAGRDVTAAEADPLATARKEQSA
jgi:hypothetical protein